MSDKERIIEKNGMKIRSVTAEDCLSAKNNHQKKSNYVITHNGMSVYSRKITFDALRKLLFFSKGARNRLDWENLHVGLLVYVEDQNGNPWGTLERIEGFVLIEGNRFVRVSEGLRFSFDNYIFYGKAIRVKPTKPDGPPAKRGRKPLPPEIRALRAKQDRYAIGAKEYHRQYYLDNIDEIRERKKAKRIADKLARQQSIDSCKVSTSVGDENERGV